MSYPQIEPFISPSELKDLIDAGQNWVPIRKAEWPFLAQIDDDHGYAHVQRVGWIQGEEPSPLDLGLPCGVILMPCTAKLIAHKENEESEPTFSTRFDPCYANVTWYGRLTEDCRRSLSGFEKTANKKKDGDCVRVSIGGFLPGTENEIYKLKEEFGNPKSESEDNEPTS